MTERSSGATWVCLVLLCGLFALTLMAPRAWQRHARRDASPALTRVTPRAAGSSDQFVPTESASRPLYTYQRGHLSRSTGVDLEPACEAETDDEFVVENLPLVGPDCDDFFPTSAERELLEQGDPFTLSAANTDSVSDIAECSTATVAEPALRIKVQLPSVDSDATHSAQTPSPVARRDVPGRSGSVPGFAPHTPDALQGSEVTPEGPSFTGVATTIVPPRVEPESDPFDTPIMLNAPQRANVPEVARVPSRPPVPDAANEISPEVAGESESRAADEVQPLRTESGWADPTVLRNWLSALSGSPTAHTWAQQVNLQLDRLAAVGGPRAANADPIVAQLRQSTTEGDRIAMRLGDDPHAEAVRRANHALLRRLVLWEHIASLPDEPDATLAQDNHRSERFLAHLSRVDELTESAPQGKSWRDYLLLDGLRELAENRQEARERRRRMAREVLDRLGSGKLSLNQRRFASADELAALRSELRHWAADPVDVEKLMREVEYYEETRAASSGEIISGFYHQLAASQLPIAQRLAKDIDTHYRGANLRIVVTDTLLTLMMPEREPTVEFVREELMGIPTSGQTTTSTNLSVRLVPDPHRLRFVLEASGLVHARTSATATGATVFAGMNSSYQILKPFEITLDGMKTDWASADAQARTHLRGVDTPLSGIPLVGNVVDGFVRQQYRERRAEAEQELRRKIIRKAVNRMESEVEERLAESNEQLRQRVLIPLQRLQLHPAVAESQTTQERLTLRLRLAADHQLAAITPRPRAPGDSLASFQIHESVLNNVFNQLDLNGRQFSQADLFLWVAERLNLPADKVPDNLRDDVKLTFAPRDSFRVRAHDGRLEIELHLQELLAEGNAFRDFTVRVYYRPDETSPTGDLVRDGVVQLIGKRITMKGQVALRGIFSKTFPRERRFSLLPARFSEDPKLANVGVSQMVVTDGWIGIALGYKRQQQHDLVTAQH